MFQINVAAAERSSTVPGSRGQQVPVPVLEAAEEFQFQAAEDSRFKFQQQQRSSSSRQQHLPCLRGSCYLLGCVMYTLDKVYTNLFYTKVFGIISSSSFNNLFISDISDNL